MRLLKNRKLNHLMRQLPEGVAVSSAWLSSQGISRQLVQKYVGSGWLNKLSRGCYVLPGSPVTWEGVLLGLTRLGNIQIHIGGLSALSRSGDVHYLELGGESKIEVWSHKRVPGWVAEVQLQPSLRFHYGKLFRDLSGDAGLTTLKTKVRDWELQISTPERAMLELLSGLGNSVADFKYASEMVEGMTLVRPSLVQQLLEGCRSVRVKRQFLFLVTYHQLRWLKKLDMEKIDTGKGKRQIVIGGRFDKQFQITVPESFVV